MHGDLVRVHVQHCRWHSRSIRHEHGRHTLFPCDQSDAQRHRRPSRHAWCILGGSSGRLCLCLAALMQCRCRRKPTCEWRGRRPCPTGTPHDRAHRRRYRQHPRFSYAAGTAIVGAGRFKWDNVQLQQQFFCCALTLTITSQCRTAIHTPFSFTHPHSFSHSLSLRHACHVHRAGDAHVITIGVDVREKQ